MSGSPAEELARRRVHVAETDLRVRRGLVRLLQAAGLHASVLDRPVVAADLDGSSSLVIDPDWPGFDVLTASRQSLARVIVLAQHPQLVDVAATGSATVLSKDCAPEDLLSAVDVALGRSSSRLAATPDGDAPARKVPPS